MAKKSVVEKKSFGNLGQKVRYSDGTERTFLNPHGKGVKYAAELRENRRVTNDMQVIKQEGLTDTQAAYRSGYLDAQKDQAAIWKKKNGRN